MPNEKGWHTKEEVLESGLPYYIPASRRWTSTPYPFAVLLTKSRCKEFRNPILSNGNEKPSAFRYSAAAGTGESSEQKRYRYIPLYDRTSLLESGEISIEQLHDHEIMKGDINQVVVDETLAYGNDCINGSCEF